MTYSIPNLSMYLISLQLCLSPSSLIHLCVDVDVYTHTLFKVSLLCHYYNTTENASLTFYAI